MTAGGMQTMREPVAVTRTAPKAAATSAASATPVTSDFLSMVKLLRRKFCSRTEFPSPPFRDKQLGTR